MKVSFLRLDRLCKNCFRCPLNCLWFGGRKAMNNWIRWTYFLIWIMSFFLADSDIFLEISMMCPLHLNQQDQLFLWAFLLYGYRCRMLKWFWMGSLAKTWRSNGYWLFKLLLYLGGKDNEVGYGPLEKSKSRTFQCMIHTQVGTFNLQNWN